MRDSVEVLESRSAASRNDAATVTASIFFAGGDFLAFFAGCDFFAGDDFLAFFAGSRRSSRHVPSFAPRSARGGNVWCIRARSADSGRSDIERIHGTLSGAAVWLMSERILGTLSGATVWLMIQHEGTI